MNTLYFDFSYCKLSEIPGYFTPFNETFFYRLFIIKLEARYDYLVGFKVNFYNYFAAKKQSTTMLYHFCKVAIFQVGQ